MPAKILIVDDSDLAAAVHSGILTKAGYQCVKAENGATALELLLTGDFSLIVSDVNMPRMNGYELVRLIRKTPGFDKIPILMVSTENEEKDVLQAMEAGANLYVVKPISAGQLTSAVNSMLKVS